MYETSLGYTYSQFDEADDVGSAETSPDPASLQMAPPVHCPAVASAAAAAPPPPPAHLVAAANTAAVQNFASLVPYLMAVQQQQQRTTMSNSNTKLPENQNNF